MSGSGLIPRVPVCYHALAAAAQQPPRAFAPYSGFDPLDGIEPGVALARDNPCRQTPR